MADPIQIKDPAEVEDLTKFFSWADGYSAGVTQAMEAAKLQMAKKVIEKQKAQQ